MRVIGFDPGMNVTGFGILDYNKRNAKAHGYGIIKPPKTKSLANRLNYLHEETMKLLNEFDYEGVFLELSRCLIINKIEVIKYADLNNLFIAAINKID